MHKEMESLFKLQPSEKGNSVQLPPLFPQLAEGRVLAFLGFDIKNIFTCLYPPSQV